jgi:3-methyladenine DNA glycosylase AlkD
MQKAFSKTNSSKIEQLESELVQQLNSLPDFSAKNLRSLRREFSKRLKLEPAKLVLELAKKLVEHGQFQFRFMAYEIVLNHNLALRSVDGKSLIRLGKGMNSWVAVDMFSCYVAGPVWREHQVDDELIKSWALSKDRWWRRAALVSTVPLNSKSLGGSGDIGRTIAICEILVKDRDDMVVKAMSWALRKLAKQDCGAVTKFLKAHDRDLAPRVIREVNDKLRTGLKNPRKESIMKRED